MKFNLKEYQNKKIKQYLKSNSLILFSINANQNSQRWVDIEQELQKLKYNYYKSYNNTTKKIIKYSICMNVANIIASTFFFLKPVTSKTRVDNKIFQLLNTNLFTLLAIKLNNKIYTIAQSKNIISLNYRKKASILYQFLFTSMKTTHSIKEF